MDSALGWIGQLVEWFARFVPRLLIVRATHGGVKWQRGSEPQAMGPGLHVYWPLVTDVEIIVTARQTDNLATQVLTTKDGQRVVVVYRIEDVVQAIGERNWDHDSTIANVTQAVIVSVIAGATLAELRDGIAVESINDRLTAAVPRQLRRFGVQVHRCSVTDFADCRVLKLVGEAKA